MKGWGCPVCLLLLVAAAAAVEPESPDIHSTPMRDFVSSGANNLEMKSRLGLYLEALEMELDSLAEEVAARMEASLELRAAFLSADSLFREYAFAQALLEEELCWFDQRAGETMSGTGWGYTLHYKAAGLLWRRILMYRHMLADDTAHMDMYPPAAELEGPIGGR